MSSPVGSMQNVKIFVLYLMENVGRTLSFVTLNEIVMRTDYVMYLDFRLAFTKMLDDGLIAEAAPGADGEKRYEITAKGKCVAESLHSDILSSILDKSLSMALRYLDFGERGITATAEVTREGDGAYIVTCTLLEKGRVIFRTKLSVDSADRAERMRDNFRDRPEVVYRGVHAMLSGNMNFLFD